MQALNIVVSKFRIFQCQGGQIRRITYPNSWHNIRSTMKRRKEKLEKLNGPPLRKPRSYWPNWNYRAELFAFGKRLNEELPESVLQRAFIQQSYVQKEKSAREDLGESEAETGFVIEDNLNLVMEGEKVMSDFIQQYIRMAFPALPEEGQRKVQDYLMADDLIAHVATHLGIPDLILSVEFPPSKATLASTFLALVGALKNTQRAEVFVKDFIISELIGKDILEIWDIPNPVGYLRNVFSGSNDELEFRLLKETGRNTIFAVYLVGIYMDRRLIGHGPGETLSIAEEMASLDALKRIFGLQPHAEPLPHGGGIGTADQFFKVHHGS